MQPEKLWEVKTDLYLVGVAASCAANAPCRLLMTGNRSIGSRREAELMCLSPDGELHWSVEFRHPTETRSICVYPNVVDVEQHGPCVFHSCGMADIDRPVPGVARLARVEDGEVIWEVPTRSQHAGNGSCVVTDIDGDGRLEILWWDSANVFCCDLVTGALRWVYDDRVQICHGRPALCDVDGDGLQELVFGTEYSCSDRMSSIVALKGDGKPLWRTDGFVDDLGSTPVIAADVNGDGRTEFLITGLNLEGRAGEMESSLWCFSDSGQLLYRKPCGCGGVAVARNEGGALVGVGMITRRDGGCGTAAEIRCFTLSDGAVLWSRDVPRVYLDAQNPVAADLIGDGRAEFLVATGNPSGYGRDRSIDPYADVYAVTATGDELWGMTFPDYVHQPFVGDIDGDGRNEMLIPCADGTLSCWRTVGKGTRPWSVTGGSFSRWYGPVE